MNALELALEKQRLQLEAAGQRLALGGHLQGLTPLFDAADSLHDGARWVKRHPEIVATGIALLAAVRPGTRRFLWRWGKRAFLAWQFWRANFPARVLAPFKR
ncbi:YqjK-like family protein [Sulfuricystis thermophila]|uniref:YqjK-like family protein n=1 Tax=Sulfuricystis thermophila TaxID=2496847 RepID=UPI001036CADB|nr:YqjK-like family protein [Sulfuricystis thermophila]